MIYIYYDYHNALNIIKIITMNDITPDTKFDIMTYNAYSKIRYRYLRFNIFLAFKSLLLIVFIPIDYTVAKGQPVILTVFMALGLALSLLDGFWNFAYYCCSINNTRLVLAICAQYNHTVSEPGNPSRVSSRIYNAQNQMQMGNEGLTDEIMNRYQSIWEVLITQTIQSNSICLTNFISFNNFLTILLFIFGIIALAVGKPNIPQIVVLSIFLFLIFIEMIKYVIISIIIIVLVALFPLICCVCCLYIFCIDHEQRKLNIPDPQPATPQMINQGGKDCPICYQSFKIGQPAVVLQCSNHHMFHPLCLSGWTQVSPTCPSCRHNLNS